MTLLQLDLVQHSHGMSPTSVQASWVLKWKLSQLPLTLLPVQINCFISRLPNQLWDLENFKPTKQTRPTQLLQQIQLLYLPSNGMRDSVQPLPVLPTQAQVDPSLHSALTTSGAPHCALEIQHSTVYFAEQTKLLQLLAQYGNQQILHSKPTLLPIPHIQDLSCRRRVSDFHPLQQTLRSRQVSHTASRLVSDIMQKPQRRLPQ